MRASGHFRCHHFRISIISGVTQSCRQVTGKLAATRRYRAAHRRALLRRPQDQPRRPTAATRRQRTTPPLPAGPEKGRHLVAIAPRARGWKIARARAPQRGAARDHGAHASCVALALNTLRPCTRARASCPQACALPPIRAVNRRDPLSTCNRIAPRGLHLRRHHLPWTHCSTSLAMAPR